MKQITRLDPALCPRAVAAISALLADGREVAVFNGLGWIAATDGIWHVALIGDPDPYANTWTDADFGFIGLADCERPDVLARIDADDAFEERLKQYTMLPVRVRVGPIEPVVCGVSQPMGHNAAEMLAESQARLVELLTKQHAALPSWACDDAALAHELTFCLLSIQSLGVTPPDRCVS